MFDILRTDPQVYASTNYQVSQQDLRKWVLQFSKPRHSTVQRQENQRIRSEIEEFFKNLGFIVSLQGTFQNVIALPPHYNGAPILCVGAHYDSVPTTPGADDNASALAAMLGCAKTLAKKKHLPQVAFVAFNAEEDGLLGSLEFVKHLKHQGLLRISQAHILEMVGYTSAALNSQQRPYSLPIEVPTVGDFLALLADHQSNLKAIIEQAPHSTPNLRVLGLQVHLSIAQKFSVLHRSDHAAFWSMDIPAMLWTDTAEFRNPHYHKPSDTPDTLDYAFLQQVTELLIAAIHLSTS
jgi:Zn-dependent M28 family amino/carboxypeptidase